MGIQILNYSGMCPGELLSLQIDVNILRHSDKWYIQAGSKTDAGRNRIIPLPEILISCIDILVDNHTASPLICVPEGGFYGLDNWCPECFNSLME